MHFVHFHQALMAHNMWKYAVGATGPKGTDPTFGCAFAGILYHDMYASDLVGTHVEMRSLEVSPLHQLSICHSLIPQYMIAVTWSHVTCRHMCKQSDIAFSVLPASVLMCSAAMPLHMQTC